ncbi:ABC transporter ATP-binding protein [Clostridium beijerinckii]|uniref:ATP-binding cassette subfamily B protein n=1 Tax=Clostridium beijerinckii TaxID=1520 RepID=A0AAE5H4L6_CLOBE|nr:ABC transporter ATP-binding protein [Clostridium beijerinckii]NSB14279.1 ATP-binding cassette subfamily B protein [Clostridium beijerinckii]OOM20993.1 putative ABC transporter ATP-binding protein [Clostridium beijerinckii]
MINMLCDKFALTKQGAKDLLQGILFSTLADIALMIPVGLIVMVIRDMLLPITDGTNINLQVSKYIIMILITLVILFAVNWMQYKSSFIAVYGESANRRINLAERLRKLPLSFFGRKDLSDLTNSIMVDCTDLEHVFSHAIPQFIGAIVSTILVGIGMLIFDWRIGIALLWVAPISFLIVICSKKLQNKFSIKNIAAKRKVADGIQECLETIKDLKAYNQEKEYLLKLDDIIDNAEKIQVRNELTTGIMVVSGQMLLKVGFATVILIGGTLLAKGKTDLFIYLVFLIAASRFYDPICDSLMNLADIFSSSLKIERMKNMQDNPVQIGAEICKTKGYDITFNHVEFSYDNKNNEKVLKDVSFTAKQGQITALVGLSGGGKSTAAKLAARFWDVTEGSITLGGVNINSVDPEVLLKNYSIVFQDVILFNDTIMNNIRLGKRNATDKEVIAAAKAACCDEFIKRMPDGYNTVIGENGSTLSGGERQRISIARALLKNAPVILLDEATASLDVENETKIQEAISNLIKDKTVLVIAHRMRTISGADKIVVLNDGYVAEQGTPSELLKQNGIYAKMVELQQESSKWKIK